MKYKKNNEDNLILPAEHGPFHIIGDVHGCFGELCNLLQKLDYAIAEDSLKGEFRVVPPAGYKTIFVGDLVDRGPDSPNVLRLVMHMVQQGIALCVIGNHDEKLVRKLNGANVHIRHGLELTLEQLAAFPDKEFVEQVRQFLSELPHHIILDNGRLVVAHAGLPGEHHGSSGRKVRALCLYGPTNGCLDEHGLPVRLDWAAEYEGHAVVVYGHTPVREPRLLNNTINIDTGCVFGGKLTALTYPDNILTSVGALQEYAASTRPF
ncbi:metallophosphoesterase [Botryobacter ruber]|uniref:metallophosphoesterase n=1 Tax=Botryobacter ruber TaxID=2171629 RepID=UPI000E0AA818|nr:metallophosphoesterase [Botryobacter ruber]